MTPLELETDWPPRQVARGNQVAYHATMGYAWLDLFGRNSWLGYGLFNVSIAVWLLPEILRMLADPGRLNVILIVFVFCVWGASSFPRQLTNWVGNGFLTHWPSKGMLAGLHYGPIRIRIDKNGIAQSGRMFGEGVAWGGITQIIEDSEVFVLGSGRNLVLMLPKTPTIRELLEAAASGPARADMIRPSR